MLGGLAYEMFFFWLDSGFLKRIEIFTGMLKNGEQWRQKMFVLEVLKDK